MGLSKITRNFQVTLPKDVREIKGLRVGDKVLFVVEKDRVDLVKMDKGIIDAAAGLWKDAKETGLEYEKRVRKQWKKRIS
ncbi:MAG TPA: AbrB/MazE/SpoVT family DNA-binding domain-containing protein [Candidatus Nanoarchaeia archaeon]|nr:AbrB/MazE/SpoVT family DNA-binding domain-containing protein [Candidatus Nanoarchaeia archaeon]